MNFSRGHRIPTDSQISVPYAIKIINIVKVRNSEVIFAKFDNVGICKRGNFAQRRITKFYNYYCIVVVTLNKDL